MCCESTASQKQRITWGRERRELLLPLKMQRGGTLVPLGLGDGAARDRTLAAEFVMAISRHWRRATVNKVVTTLPTL